MPTGVLTAPGGAGRGELDGLEAKRARGLADGAEVSTESNPESVDRRALDELRAAGFTRISFGMQSASEHVLAQLDRFRDQPRV